MAASRTIEAKLVISGEGGDRVSAEIAKVTKAIKDTEAASRVSNEVLKFGRAFEQVSRQAKAAQDVLAARGPLEATVKNMQRAGAESARLARDLDAARKAADDFAKTQRILKGTEAATQMAEMTRKVRDLGTAHRAAEREAGALARAFDVETRALRAAEGAASRLGVDLSRVEQQQRSLARATQLAAVQFERQAIAEERASHRRAQRREAVGTIAAGAGVVAAAKGRDLGQRAVLSVVDFDYAIREQQAFGEISKADQNRLLIPQAMQIGRETKFSNTDIINAQTTVAQRLPKNLPRADVAHAITQNVQYYAQALHADMKTSAESITAYLMATGKDMSTFEKAQSAARRSTNILLQSAKLSGSTDNDLQNFTRFGVPAGHQAGFSDEFMGAFQAGMKRAGVGGDQAGTAMKTISARLIAPTQKGAAAEAAAGIDRSRFTKMPGELSVESMERKFRLDFGKSFTESQRAQLGEVLSDPEIIGERERFVEEVSKIQMESFAKNTKGKYSAADQNKVAKKATEFHKFNVENVDVQGLLLEILKKDPSLGVLNAIVTDKHGGKVGALAKMMEYFVSDLETLRKVPDDFGKKISDTITGGVGGSFEKLKGSIETFTLNIGLANKDLLKVSFDKIGDTIDKFSDLPQWAQQATSIGGAAAASAGGVYGAYRLTKSLLGLGGGPAALTGSAAALTKSAALLDAAAIKLAGGSPADLVKDPAKKGGKVGGLIKGAVGLTAAGGLAELAQSYGVLKLPDVSKDGLGRSALNLLDPNLGNLVLGPAAPADAQKQGEKVGDALAKGVNDGVQAGPLPSRTHPKMLDAEAAGREGTAAGQKVGQGVADGVQEKAPEVEAQGKTLWQRLKDTMASPIYVPISFAPGEGFGGGGGGGGGLIQRASAGGGIVKAAYHSDGAGAFGGVRRSSGGGAIPGRNAFGGVDSLAGDGSAPDGVSRSGGSRSWRNNNPGNIEYGPFARSMGATGTDGRFARFPNYGAGRRAQERLLFESSGYRDKTLAGAIARWAPGSENNVPAYIRAMGADPGTRMRDFSPEQRAKLLDAMQRHEGWRPGVRRGGVAPAPVANRLTVPDAPAGGFGGGRGGINAAADKIQAAAEMIQGSGFHGQISLAITGSARDRARVTGLRMKNRGAVSADMGVSMPGAKEGDDDWS